MNAPADNDIHAFPTSSIDGFTQHGMTLRDWLAGQALVGIGTWMPIADPYNKAADLKTGEALKLRAEWAYRQADAMLQARSGSVPTADIGYRAEPAHTHQKAFDRLIGEG